MEETLSFPRSQLQKESSDGEDIPAAIKMAGEKISGQQEMRCLTTGKRKERGEAGKRCKMVDEGAYFWRDRNQSNPYSSRRS